MGASLNCYCAATADSCSLLSSCLHGYSGYAAPHVPRLFLPFLSFYRQTCWTVLEQMPASFSTTSCILSPAHLLYHCFRFSCSCTALHYTAPAAASPSLSASHCLGSFLERWVALGALPAYLRLHHLRTCYPLLLLLPLPLRTAPACCLLPLGDLRCTHCLCLRIDVGGSLPGSVLLPGLCVLSRTQEVHFGFSHFGFRSRTHLACCANTCCCHLTAPAVSLPLVDSCCCSFCDTACAPIRHRGLRAVLIRRVDTAVVTLGGISSFACRVAPLYCTCHCHVRLLDHALWNMGVEYCRLPTTFCLPQISILYTRTPIGIAFSTTLHTCSSYTYTTFTGLHTAVHLLLYILSCLLLAHRLPLLGLGTLYITSPPSFATTLSRLLPASPFSPCTWMRAVCTASPLDFCSLPALLYLPAACLRCCLDRCTTYRIFLLPGFGWNTFLLAASPTIPCLHACL